MVISTDYKTSFISSISSKRLLVLSYIDIDSICCWKIFKEILKKLGIFYTLVVISNKEQLVNEYNKNRELFTNFFLINMGANFDIIQLLEPSRDSIFYICDSHRPINLNNYYNQRQVILLCLDEDTSNIPSFEYVYRDDSDDEDLTQEERLDRNSERREWEARRLEILINYEGFSYHSNCSSMVSYDLAMKLSLNDSQLLWYTIVAFTSQLLTNQISRNSYEDQIEWFMNNVKNIDHVRRQGQISDEEVNFEHSIKPSNEPFLWLYRHWTLKSSLENTLITAAKFRLFTEKGSKRLDEFLALVGLAKRESEQTYSTISKEIKDIFINLLPQCGEKFGFSLHELFLRTFLIKSGHNADISTIDNFFLMLASLEVDGSSDPIENFHRASSILSCWELNAESFEKYSSLAKSLVSSLVLQVRGLLDSDDVILFGPFLYVHILSSSLKHVGLKNMISNTIFGRYILMAKASVKAKIGNRKKTSQIPLIVCYEMPTERDDEPYLQITGFPPIQGDSEQNLFGQAFEAAANRSGSRIRNIYMENYRIDIHKDDLLKLFDSLVELLS